MNLLRMSAVSERRQNEKTCIDATHLQRQHRLDPMLGGERDIASKWQPV